jgi:hypothetical protein
LEELHATIRRDVPRGGGQISPSLRASCGTASIQGTSRIETRCRGMRLAGAHRRARCSVRELDRCRCRTVHAIGAVEKQDCNCRPHSMRGGSAMDGRACTDSGFVCSALTEDWAGTVTGYGFRSAIHVAIAFLRADPRSRTSLTSLGLARVAGRGPADAYAQLSLTCQTASDKPHHGCALRVDRVRVIDRALC